MHIHLSNPRESSGFHLQALGTLHRSDGFFELPVITTSCEPQQDHAQALGRSLVNDLIPID